MKKVKTNFSVSDATDTIKASLETKGFTIFCDIDHQANAENVDIEMPASRVLIFGNPVAGSKLMQKDIAISLDLPMRIAVVDDGGQTLILHQTSEDYSNYDVQDHPVLDKVASLFEALASELK